MDDKPDLLEITRLYFGQSTDFRVTTAPSAGDRLEKPATAHFDEIVPDYLMPGTDTIGFFKMRSRKGNVPFIVITGGGLVENAIGAISIGVDFYPQKGGPEGRLWKSRGQSGRQAA